MGPQQGQPSTAWVHDSVAIPSPRCAAEAEAHQQRLTKPPGSLGRLEALVVKLAALQHSSKPSLERMMIRVFAADHGVAAQGVSAFPQSVTVEMIRNFAAGGAAISVLAKQLGADFGVVDMGTVQTPGLLAGVVDRRQGAASGDITVEPAMNASQLAGALDAGREVASSAAANGVQLFIGGEMGIGNSTAAAALACALLDKPARALVGRGTGIDDQGLELKRQAVAKALGRHRLPQREPLVEGLSAMRSLGGFEIAALAGCYIACAQRGIPSLVDGFISSVAALAAVTVNRGVRQWMLFSHQSAEPGHRLVLEAMQARVLVSLEMRLGEGSGAAVVVPLMQSACLLHREMATFEGAGVSRS